MKDGSQKIRKSPEKSFVETDKYTIHLPDGSRNLVIENTLGQIENKFISVLKRIRRRESLTKTDKVRLCAFAAAMHTRTTSMGEHWKGQMQKLHDQIVEMEKVHNVPPQRSIETAEMVEHAHQQIIADGIQTQVPLLYHMAMTILITKDELGFVTSDAPCVWFNPSWYKLPPFYRSPGLVQREIEITLPLTPQHLMLIFHSRRAPEYLDASNDVLNDLNRRTRFHCFEEFVSWKGETKPEWFDIGIEPEDSWEKSPEGIRAIQDKEEMRKWREGGERPAFAMPPPPSEVEEI